MDTYTTTNFGCAAFASVVKGCLVVSQKTGRGRANFTIHLHEGCRDGNDLWNEWLLSEYYLFDESVRRFKQGTY